MISVTPIFFPNWVLVPQAVASMVSFLSRAKPAMLAKSSRLVKSRTLKTTFVRRDLVRMFPLLVAAPMAETVVRLAAHGTLAASSEDNYERYLYVNQKQLAPGMESGFPGANCHPPRCDRGSRRLDFEHEDGRPAASIDWPGRIASTSLWPGSGAQSALPDSESRARHLQKVFVASTNFASVQKPIK